MTAQRTEIREWEWTPLSEALDTVRLWQMNEYIHQRQNTVAAQVACYPIYEL